MKLKLYFDYSRETIYFYSIILTVLIFSEKAFRKMKVFLEVSYGAIANIHSTQTRKEEVRCKKML